MKLSILIPTIGRDTLKRAVESISTSPEIQIVLVGDGEFLGSFLYTAQVGENGFTIIHRFPRSGDCGYSARNIGLPAATGEWLAFMDDDDYFTPEGVRTILEYCNSHHEKPAVFKMQRLAFGDTLWHVPELRLANQGQQQFVCRNSPHLPRWQTHYSADFDWMKAVASSVGGVNFIDKVTVVCPKQNLGK